MFASGKVGAKRAPSPWGIRRGGFQSLSNPVNRILRDARHEALHGQLAASTIATKYLSESDTSLAGHYSPAEIAHARRVLPRLCIPEEL